jgi:serralysin
MAFTSMDSGTAGYAYSGTPTSPGGKVGDIWLNSDDTGETYDAGTYGFTTMLHEIGHTLGLKHPFESPTLPAEYDNTRFTLMAYDPPSDGLITTFTSTGGGLSSSREYVVEVTPMVIDIAAVQAIYGAETTTRTGNTVYAYGNDDGAVLRAIYDAGGNDTIDMSACTRDCVIDLTPGAYSSIAEWSTAEQIAYWQGLYPWAASFIAAQFDANSYEWHDNLGIALGTTIENATGGSANDTILGNNVGNVLTGNGGNDTLEGFGGNDTLRGGGGIDTVTYEAAAAGVTVNLGLAGGQATGGAGTDTISGFENLTGSTHDDTLSGNGAVNTVEGLAGNDTLNGRGGNDVLLGDGGNDVLNGNGGADAMTGGLGNDLYYVNNAGDTVTESSSSGGTDQVNTTLSFTLGNNVENLVIVGNGTSNGTGNSLDNVLQGNAAANIFKGLAGADTLKGGAGDDSLNGGTGQDTLVGGAGNDKFVFNTGDTIANHALADHITDFASGDHIDLHNIDANTTVGGDQAFTFIGTAGFSAAGQLHYATGGGSTWIEGDTNGDGSADFAIYLVGNHTMAGTDFVL